MIMFRVENSLGPFFSLSKSMPRRVGKRVEWILDSWLRAEEVVDKAFKQSRVSWSRVSSCSTLYFHVNQALLDGKSLHTSIPPY